MGHWTSHAFHATVVSPHMMYEDVTVGFSDGFVTFSGRPLRNWRAWAWLVAVVRLALVSAAFVALSSIVLSRGVGDGLSTSLIVRIAVVAVLWAIAMWVTSSILRHYAQTKRGRASERVSKVAVSEVSMARLSGRVLSIRAPFDQQNASDRWRLRVDSHDQGESLLALIGRH